MGKFDPPKNNVVSLPVDRANRTTDTGFSELSFPKSQNSGRAVNTNRSASLVKLGLAECRNMEAIAKLLGGDTTYHGSLPTSPDGSYSSLALASNPETKGASARVFTLQHLDTPSFNPETRSQLDGYAICESVASYDLSKDGAITSVENEERHAWVGEDPSSGEPREPIMDYRSQQTTRILDVPERLNLALELGSVLNAHRAQARPV